MNMSVYPLAGKLFCHLYLPEQQACVSIFSADRAKRSLSGERTCSDGHIHVLVLGGHDRNNGETPTVWTITLVT